MTLLIDERDHHRLIPLNIQVLGTTRKIFNHTNYHPDLYIHSHLFRRLANTL